MTKRTKETLLRYAEKYERTFPSPDPSEFLKTAEGANNQEATAFVAACLSFGSIEQFMPRIEQLIEWSQDSGGMDQWIRRGAFNPTFHVRLKHPGIFWGLGQRSSLHFCFRRVSEAA